MSWLSTIVTAVVTAALGTVLSGYTAVLAVRWYRISGFEGKSGYYVVAMALLGLIVGLVIGLVISRIVAASANPGTIKALGISLTTMAVLVAVVGGIGRLKADVPPQIDGEDLMLMVEARWPATQTESPANTPGLAYVELGSVVSRVQRASARGALWKEDAHLVDGRWVVPGAVFLFTERGDRVITVALNDSSRSGIVSRLPARPGKKDMEWSEWGPTDGRNGPVRNDGITYRYRVQKVSSRLRTETVGRFSVSAIAASFTTEYPEGLTTLDPYARFEIEYDGKPVQITAGGGSASHTGMLIQLPSEKPALLAYIEPEKAPSYCALLVDEGTSFRQERVSSCSNSIQVQELTSDTTAFAAMKSAKNVHGRVDRRTYASSTLLNFNQVVLNSRTLALYPLNDSLYPTDVTPVISVPPLGVSPDQHSFARFGYGSHSAEQPLLLVTDFVHNRVYTLPIERSRMRYADFADLTPAWLMHHFEWTPGTEGSEKLRERPNFVPIPYAGDIDEDEPGKFSYRIASGGQDVRMALLAHIEKEFGATRDSVEATAYQYPVTIEGRKLEVASTGGNDYVLVSLAHGEPNSDIAARIGRSFNAVLATGRLDALFVK